MCHWFNGNKRDDTLSVFLTAYIYIYILYIYSIYIFYIYILYMYSIYIYSTYIYIYIYKLLGFLHFGSSQNYMSSANLVDFMFQIS